MRVRIYESRHHNASACIHNFRIAKIFFDLIARTYLLDLPVADEHSAIANNPYFRQLCAEARALWSAQRDEFRSVQNDK
jgi:hypothetical protein